MIVPAAIAVSLDRLINVIYIRDKRSVSILQGEARVEARTCNDRWSSRCRRPYVPIREPNAANQREIAASARGGFCVTTNYRVAEPLRRRYRAPLSVTE